MKELTAEQISDNWNEFLKIIDEYITGDRKHQLLSMYNSLQDRIIIAPASGVIHYHNCFPGGYVEHVLNVIKCSLLTLNIWEEYEANINFTKEELIFAAINHDLGKIGDLTNDYYIPNDSEWHKKNRGEIYKHNPKLSYMKVPDRSIFILQSFKIDISENEFLGIKLHDGMYVEENKTYFMAHNPDNSLKTHLPIILHHADLMATRIEHDEYLKTKNPAVESISKMGSNTNKSSRMKALAKMSENSPVTPNANKIFNEFMEGNK